MQNAGMLKRWRWREASEDIKSQSAAALAKELGVPNLVAELLLLRGAKNSKQAKYFLEPKLSYLNDPSKLPGAKRSAKRIVEAIKKNQPIIIYGDYDVDGVTASSILYHVLRALKAQVQIYIPRRLDEGYGINEDAIRTLVKENENNNQNREEDEKQNLLIVS